MDRLGEGSLKKFSYFCKNSIVCDFRISAEKVRTLLSKRNFIVSRQKSKFDYLGIQTFPLSMICSTSQPLLWSSLAIHLR